MYIKEAKQTKQFVTFSNLYVKLNQGLVWKTVF